MTCTANKNTFKLWRSTLKIWLHLQLHDFCPKLWNRDMGGTSVGIKVEVDIYSIFLPCLQSHPNKSFPVFQGQSIRAWPSIKRFCCSTNGNHCCITSSVLWNYMANTLFRYITYTPSHYEVSPKWKFKYHWNSHNNKNIFRTYMTIALRFDTRLVWLNEHPCCYPAGGQINVKPFETLALKNIQSSMGRASLPAEKYTI